MNQKGIICKCRKCGRVSARSKEYLEVAECHACGGHLEPVEPEKDELFDFACANCGYTWKWYIDKICPVCDSLDIMIQYEDINTKPINELQKNIEEGKEFTWVCESCGKTKELYGNPTIISNVACPNGCDDLMVQQINTDELIAKLKEYRGSKRWNQSLMAATLGISQSYYSGIEGGRKEISPKLAKQIQAL